MLPGRVVAVLGPTGVGKSELGIALAQRLGGEVVNADSMQLYRGMDIGTAKLPFSGRRGVPHHLLDVWDVSRTASVAAYQELARSVLAEILARRSVPVLVGGSGLYLRAVLDDLQFPGTDPGTRGLLEAELAALGPNALHERLLALDPVSAARIHRQNGRRIVRALEVIELTGQPYSATLPSYTSLYDVVHVGLDIEPESLDVRLEKRIAGMWAAGLVEEVLSLVPRGLRDGVTASRALGYAQALSYVDGLATADEARMATVYATRRFVRRQRSWFRRDPRIRWYDGESVDADAIARTIGP
ncbi:MAG: tRNA (adenosine(37)-N6)-dimethylallyltransferase MiaA [Geodermatophilaceae bacterium]|nr:tRNA (adenosine(37)-N6)-dimethylallyltransferase MiaA [Geodermatophilaceae bacterium]